MIIERMPDPFEAVIIKDTFSENELIDIWKELSFLTRRDILLDPEQTGSAINVQDGSFLKKNKAIFMYELYAKANASPIISYTAKNIFSEPVFRGYEKIGSMHKTFSRTNQNTTLLSYYENSDYYNFHTDDCLYTSVTYLFKEPKNFSGGDITFKLGDDTYKQTIENNLSIVFPSFYQHMVDEIKMNGKFPEYGGYGRYCITQFAFLGAR